MKVELTCHVCGQRHNTSITWHPLPPDGHTQTAFASAGDGYFIGENKIEGWVCGPKCLQAHCNFTDLGVVISSVDEPTIIHPTRREEMY